MCTFPTLDAAKRWLAMMFARWPLQQDPDAELLPLEAVLPAAMAIERVPPPDAGLR